MIININKERVSQSGRYNIDLQKGAIMPLTMLPIGKEGVIDRCRAKESTKKFLEGLGIIPGVTLSVISEINGNMIISIKGTRIALSKGLAQQLTVIS